ncbi:conserved hypothetical protein [Uncinocarpus reesii 1704]|uniref:Cell cycle control protein cwf19 n=1 Tax=Uncinocarpus reesii (strain UAMH 1704) TaxID=336963 RepID=C4JS90_UNCRE|nr:uncharacterized protein UREG_05329 [Uncinocarpus reesii 1704]EEP80487.1 conserved hypothetical protein [Uncinocarpus reesii 1704]
MALEDFEKELAESQREREKEKEREKRRERHRERNRDRDRDHRRHADREKERDRGKEKDSESNRDEARSRHHHDRHHHHRSSRHGGNHSDEERKHRHKRSRHHSSSNGDDRDRSHKRRHRHESRDEKDDERSREQAEPSVIEQEEPSRLKRDAWMEAPSALDIDFVNRRKQKSPSPKAKMLQADFEYKLHEKELNRHLHDVQETDPERAAVKEPAEHEVDYEFGDAGSQWRMTKLRAVYRQAEEEGRKVEEVAIDRYGDLRSFDDAREEEIELDRRERIGSDYVGKIKPSGELYQERKLEMGVRREKGAATREEDIQTAPNTERMETDPPAQLTKPLDTTALNRLKAQMMKAKLRGSSDAGDLEAQYNAAVAAAADRKEPDVVVLGVMDNRMLAGQRAEAKPIENKRGRERGLVQDNEDMSIEDMVREERRTRGQAGGEGMRFAERIAKDAKFDNDLEYMDENAAKLAKRVQRSELNIKNTAINEFQKMNRILDNCPLCHHEDSDTPPTAPMVSLATRVYLTLPTEPELNEGAACIVPIQHRTNLLECDDDEWEEIRNFMKCLTRMYHDQGRDVIFYENAARPQQKRHAAMEAVPLPYSLGETAPAFFKEAILAADEEWTQHKKVIDTLAKSRQGLGKLAFRRTLAKEMPYFHVWFELDGGLAHIVEDSNRWPRGDLFAREIIGGMLDLEPDVIKRQGRWQKGGDRRVDGFKKRWRKFDWTRVLAEG